MINLKRKVLAVCIVAGLSSVAVAQDRTNPHHHRHYDAYQNSQNMPTYQTQRDYRTYRDFQERNRDYRNTQDGAYLVKLSITKDGEDTKNFQFRTNKANEFLVLNSEEITYKVNPDNNRHRNDRNHRNNRDVRDQYGKVQTGIAIRGTITPSDRHRALQNVNLKIVNNDLMGFGESCHGRRCVNMPNEVLTQYDVSAQTYYGTVTPITEFRNSNGKRVRIQMQIEPLPQ